MGPRPRGGERLKLDDIAGLMERCGLSDKEARAFVHLTNLGPSKVTDLATAADLKRAETYQILEKLQGRGLVEGTLARPRTFTAVPPGRAVEILVEERTRELKAVEAMQEDVRKRLESLAGATAEPTQGSFRILQDLNQITGQLKRTIRAAKREIVAVASSRSLFRLLLDEGLEDEIKAARDHGVKVRILTEILPGQESDVERLLAFAEVRHLMVPRPLRFFVADDAEIVQYVTADPMTGGAKETALWIGASDHVQAQRAFIDDLWSAAIPARGRLEELRTGRPPPQVQLVKGRFTRYEKAKEMIMRAQREVLAYLPKGEAERLERSGLKRALDACAKQGVRVRLLVGPGGAAKVGAGVDARAVDVEELPTLVVDGAEALVVVSGGTAGEAEVTALDESGVWITVPSSVALIAGRLEAAWSQASK